MLNNLTSFAQGHEPGATSWTWGWDVNQAFCTVPVALAVEVDFFLQWNLCQLIQKIKMLSRCPGSLNSALTPAFGRQIWSSTPEHQRKAHIPGTGLSWLGYWIRTRGGCFQLGLPTGEAQTLVVHFTMAHHGFDSPLSSFQPSSHHFLFEAPS